MKKGLLTFVTILSAAIILVACGSSKPKTMSQETYDNGCRALEVMEKYNDMEVSAEDAEERLDSIDSSMEKETFAEGELIAETDNLLIRMDIHSFIYALHGMTGSTYDAEDELRERLGK